MTAGRTNSSLAQKPRWSWVAAVCALVACGGDDRPSSDGGVLTFDAAMIRQDGSSPDAGMDAGGDGGGVDAGTDAALRDAGRDVAPDVFDAGPSLVCSLPDPGSDCVLLVPLGSFGPLSSSCLPRCTAETAAAYRACDNQSCRNMATRSDTSPGLPYFIGRASVTPPLNCESCVGYQEFHCFSLACSAQVDSYVDNCIVGVDPFFCDAAVAMVDACLASLSPGQMETVDECMNSVDGPPGCFACE